MLVTDERRGVRLLENALGLLGSGYEGAICELGRGALAFRPEAGVAVVLIHTPAGDDSAIALIRELRRHASRDEQPIVLLRAGGGSEARVAAFRAGADEVLDIPLDPELLRERVEGLLERGEAAMRVSRQVDELVKKNAHLERLQREQGELMTFIVHDLKTPLSVVWSSLDFAREKLVGQAALIDDSLIEAASATSRLRSMVDDLLTMGRLEDSSFQLHLETVPVGEVVGEVVREYRPIAGDRKVQLISPGRGRASARTDRTLLRRVLENIVDNSVRHTPVHGRVSVATGIASDVTIAVSNSGPAIPVGERRRIFEKYARLDKRGPLRGHVGVGLYFCKRALDALGGAIEVTETPEWPTSFVLHLPAA